jgi:hypothetical protein
MTDTSSADTGADTPTIEDRIAKLEEVVLKIQNVLGASLRGKSSPDYNVGEGIWRDASILQQEQDTFTRGSAFETSPPAPPPDPYLPFITPPA